jgi:hypothetical protein
MKNKLILLLASCACIFLTNCNSIKSPFLEISPISGERKIGIGIEGTLLGKTVGTGAWINE